MSCQRRDRHYGALITSAALLPLCVGLTACGGGEGGGVATIPPPPPTPTPTPTPTPAVASITVETSWLTSPATKTGSYDLVALVSRTNDGNSTNGMANSGEFQLNVSKASSDFQYVLDASSGFLPGSLTSILIPVPIESWDFNPGGPNYRYDNPYGDYQQFFGQNLKEYEIYSDQSEKLRENYDYDHAVRGNAIIELPNGQLVNESLIFDIGLSYVAMGEWSWGTVTQSADGSAAPTGDKNSVFFVYGSRTPGSGIPASGTATYDARSLGDVLGNQTPFTLTADFGQRSISTEINQYSLFDVSGSAPFSNDGSFAISLSGTAGSQAASGSMDGAFFGPHAEQVGGVFSVGSQGNILMQDAFVGARH